MFVQQNSSIYSKKIKNKWIILEKNKKYTQELNITANFIWELCAHPIEIDHLIKKICSEFDIDQETATQDVETFIQEYLKKKFLILK